MDEVDIQDPWDKRESRAGIDKLSSPEILVSGLSCLGWRPPHSPVSRMHGQCGWGLHHGGRQVRVHEAAGRPS
jgi:hypothetical protein